MNSYPIGDLPPIGTSGDLLTEEQHAFAITLGRILAEQWEQQLRRSATGEASPPSTPTRPEEGPGRETSPDDH